MTNSSFSRTRYAPTPSGFLHLGNLYSFALTATISRHVGAKILLRIDDLDRKRVRQEYIEDIFQTLRFMDLPWEYGPANATEFAHQYSQLHRLTLYQELLRELESQNLLFACTCSRTDILRVSADGNYQGQCLQKGLPLDTPGSCWRLDTRRPLALLVYDLAGDSISATLPESMQFFVVRKKDGQAAYQTASLADDLYFGIDLIVRGKDLWDSTLAQLYMATLLRWESFQRTRFVHHPLLEGRQGQKLSKSAGDMSIQYLRKEGRSAGQIYGLLGATLPGFVSIMNWRDIPISPFTVRSNANG